MRKLFITSLAVSLIVIAGSFIFITFQKDQLVKSIQSFEDCKNAGFPILESYPEQCRTPDGRMFTNSAKPQSITVSGEMVCLPHKDQSGPQTLECAMGLKADDGTYYSLRDSDPEYKNISSVGTGAKITVTGEFTPQLDGKYRSIGVISISSLTSVD